MKFVNNGEPIKARIGFENCYWKTVRRGDVIDLPEKYGKALGLDQLKTTEGRIANKVVETKQIEVPVDSKDFLKELKSIKGIGEKTAKDIISWGSRQKLIDCATYNKFLPFRDDVVEKLRRKYNGAV